MNEQKVNEIYFKIIKDCKTNKTTFKDPDFLPNENSLGKMNFGKNGKCVYEIPHFLYWLRPDQINMEDEEEEWSVMNNPCPSDIVQSQLIGDCWLMAPISAIADHQDILDNIFPSKEVSPYGVYRVKLFLNGEWRYIIVDDYIPCFVETSKIAVGFAKRKQLWVSLIEKALAKTFGSYSELWGRFHMKTAFSWLTGTVGIRHGVPRKADDIHEFWTILMSSKLAGFLVACSTISDEKVYEKSIAVDHTYLIVDLNDEYGNRLLRLRNPWGVVEWSGKWANDWEGWPKDMKTKLLDDRKKESAAFWIELDDFINICQSITICKIWRTRFQFRETLKIGLDTKTIRFTITETCETVFDAFLKMHPPDKIVGQFESTNQSLEQEDIMMSIHRISRINKIGEMVGRTDRSYTCHASTEDLILDPGEYIIILFDLVNKNSKNLERALVCNSTKLISYKLVQQSTNMLKKALREVVLKDGTLETDNRFGIYIRGLRENFDGLLIMVDNFMTNKNYFHLTTDCSESKGYVSSRGSLESTDVIPPNSYKIVMILSDQMEPHYYARWGFEKLVTSEKYITAKRTHDESIVKHKLTSFPKIDASDWVHSKESLFEDSYPEVRRCQKKVKHSWLISPMDEQPCKEYYNRIIEHCKTFKTSFKDSDFLPNENSIGKMRNNGEPVDQIADFIIWLRPHQINTEDEEDQWSVMNNPVPTDVVQSPLVGDFGLMSPLAAVANRPDILNKIFVSKEVSPYGVYRVKLFLNGKWQYIIVDDYIPCYVETSKIAVGFAKRKQLWVSLIEKALAKTLGSYSQLWGRFNMKTAFSRLTGAVSGTLKVTGEPDELWRMLMDAKLAKFLMTCCTVSDEAIHEKIHGKCTVPDHTFLILDINDEYDHRLLRLQNPWGAVEWYGKWSNDWDGWPSHMKEKLLNNRKDTSGSAFWIAYDDFIKMFQTFSISRIRPNRHEFRETLTIGLDTQTIRFTITETCEAVFEAVSKQEPLDLIEDTMMSIHRISKNNKIGEMVGSTGHEFAVFKFTEDLILDPGEYIIILFNLENRNRLSIPMKIVCYSTKPIFYEWVQQSIEILKQALREVILKNGILETFAHIGVHRRKLRKEVMGTLVMAENFTSDKYFHVIIDASGAENYVNKRGEMQTTDVIPPRSYKIVMNLFRDRAKEYKLGGFITRSCCSYEKYITAGCTHDESIIDRRLISYPSIDPSDWVHSTESLSHEINQMDEDVRRSMNIL